MDKHIESSERITFPERIINLFWSKVDKNGPVPSRYPELGPCWIWNGCRDKKNYGQFKPGSSLNGAKSWRSNRFSWQITFGNIPDELNVCHHCDNPPCVNPSHFFLGTHEDNHRDRDMKGRGRIVVYKRTPFNVPSKLTPEQVSEIRALYIPGQITQRQIATQFNVAHQTISNIVRFNNWTKNTLPPKS